MPSNMTPPTLETLSVFIPRQLVRKDTALTEEQLREILALYVTALQDRFPKDLPPEYQWRMNAGQDAKCLRWNINWLYQWTLVFAASDALELALFLEDFFRGTSHLDCDPSVPNDIALDTAIFVNARGLTSNLIYEQGDDRAELDWNKDVCAIKRQLHKLKRLMEVRCGMYVSLTQSARPAE